MCTLTYIFTKNTDVGVHNTRNTRNGNVIRMIGLIFTGEVDACPQRLQWGPGQSSWYFRLNGVGSSIIICCCEDKRWRCTVGCTMVLLFETQILVLISIKMLDISNFSRSLEEAICNNFFRTTHKVLLEHDHCKCFHFFSVVTFIFVVCVTVTDTKPIEDSWARGSYQW